MRLVIKCILTKRKEVTPRNPQLMELTDILEQMTLGVPDLLHLLPFPPNTSPSGNN